MIGVRFRDQSRVQRLGLGLKIRFGDSKIGAGTQRLGPAFKDGGTQRFGHGLKDRGGDSKIGAGTHRSGLDSNIVARTQRLGPALKDLGQIL